MWVGECKLSPEFAATTFLEILYNLVRRALTLLFSEVLQLTSLSIFDTLSNCWYMYISPQRPSGSPSLHHCQIAGTIVFHTFTRVPNSITVFQLGCVVLMRMSWLSEKVNLPSGLCLRNPSVLYPLAVTLLIIIGVPFHIFGYKRPRYLVFGTVFSGTPWRV